MNEALGLAALVELASPARWLPGPLLGLAVARVFASMTAEAAKLDRRQRTRTFQALASYCVPFVLFGWFWISGSEVQRAFMGLGAPASLAIYAALVAIGISVAVGILLVGFVPGVKTLRAEYDVVAKSLHQRQLDRINRRLMGGNP